MLTQTQIQAVRTLVSSYFKNSKGEPYVLTDGQCELFAGIVNKNYRWVWESAPTRYGKTDVTAMALLYLAVFEKLKIPVVGGSQEKAEKIMEYVLMHIPDHAELYQGLINVDISDVDKLKVQMSKEALRWYDGGWIYVTSIDSRNIKKEGEGVVGEGGDVVVLEEAGLIKRKEQFSKVVRMPEEDKGWGKLVMLGNCIEGSVFEDAYKDDKYLKIRIGLEQAINEGRYSESYLEEKKTDTTAKDWKRYYLVEFPAANEFTYFKPKKYDLLANDLEYYGSLDPALGENAKGSLTAITILGRSKSTGQVYEIESMGELMGPEETIRTIFNFPYTFNRFVIEAVQFQKYFLDEINRKSKELKKYIPFDGITQKRKKEERIESLEPAIKTGQILFRGDNKLWEHMQDYPESEHLDILDSLEMCWRTIKEGDFDFAIV